MAVVVLLIGQPDLRHRPDDGDDLTLVSPIDHAAILVPDLAAAGTAFKRAGFQVTPEARQFSCEHTQ